MREARLPPQQARALQWHLANLEYGCATPLSNVSLAWWDQDDSAGMEGDHAIVVGGYAKLVDALAQHTQARGGGGARRAGAPSELAASPPALP